jgi:hypothetical protein
MISIEKAHTIGDRWDKYLKNKGNDLTNPISLNKISLNLPSFNTIKEFVANRKLTISIHGQQASLDVSVFDNFNNLLGIHNVEHRYGGRVKQKENKEVKELLGTDNILKLGLNPEYTHISLLVYTPGSGTPMHFDGLEKDEYRFLTAASPWDWGHMLQIHDKVITHWDMGDTYQVPAGIWHLSTSVGISPKYSFAITGLKNKG